MEGVAANERGRRLTLARPIGIYELAQAYHTFCLSRGLSGHRILGDCDGNLGGVDGALDEGRRELLRGLHG